MYVTLKREKNSYSKNDTYFLKSKLILKTEYLILYFIY